MWYQERLSEEKAKEIIRGEEKEIRGARVEANVSSGSNDPPEHMRPQNEMSPGIHFFTAEPIIDRKSTFIGRACRISDPSEVRPLRMATNSGSKHTE